eukprot:s88_g8.t1
MLICLSFLGARPRSQSTDLLACPYQSLLTKIRSPAQRSQEMTAPPAPASSNGLQFASLYVGDLHPDVGEDIPTPGRGEVLVKVFASNINPVDHKIVGLAGWSWSYPHKLGYDVAGVVQALGAGCERLKPGDEVWGEATSLMESLTTAGTYAQYAVVSEYAGGWGHAYGGGTGHLGIQLAKAMGAAWVITTCSDTHSSFVRQLGADQDYHKQNYYDVLLPKSVDVVYDCVGMDGTGDHAYGIIKEHGSFVTLLQGGKASLSTRLRRPDVHQYAPTCVGSCSEHTKIDAVASMATLYEAFSSAGNVASCRVCRDNATRKSLGYGYVNYYSVQDAERALETLNYMSIKGKPCRVMWSQRDPERRRNTASNIFVKGLDPTIDNKALHDTFSVFGNILSCKVSTDNNGKSRGYGFVHYEAEEAAKIAIEKVNGMKIANSTVFVGPFIKREERGEETIMENYTNLYIKNMPPSWDDAKVAAIFAEFGEVSSSVLLNTDDGKRFALVNFKAPEAAKAAVDALHRKDMRPELGEEAKDEAPKEDAPEKETEKGDDAKEDGEEKEKEATEEKEGDQEKKDEEEDHPEHLLYVQRAQTRTTGAPMRPKQPRVRARRCAPLKLQRLAGLAALALHQNATAAFTHSAARAGLCRRSSSSSVPRASEAEDGSSPWPLSAEDVESLRQVVLVHRHGARFPTKPTGKADLAWPIRTSFWES